MPRCAAALPGATIIKHSKNCQNIYALKDNHILKLSTPASGVQEPLLNGTLLYASDVQINGSVMSAVVAVLRYTYHWEDQ